MASLRRLMLEADRDTMGSGRRRLAIESRGWENGDGVIVAVTGKAIGRRL